jgi:hypothetical protein
VARKWKWTTPSGLCGSIRVGVEHGVRDERTKRGGYVERGK